MERLRLTELPSETLSVSVTESEKAVASLKVDAQVIQQTMDGRCDGLTSNITQETEARIRDVSEIRAGLDELRPIGPACEALKLSVAESEKAVASLKADVQGFRQTMNGQFDDLAQKLARESVRKEEVIGVRVDTDGLSAAQHPCNGLQSRVAETERALSVLQISLRRVSDIQQCLGMTGAAARGRADVLAQRLREESETRGREVSYVRNGMSRLHLVESSCSGLMLRVAESETAIVSLLADLSSIRQHAYLTMNRLTVLQEADETHLAAQNDALQELQRHRIEIQQRLRELQFESILLRERIGLHAGWALVLQLLIVLLPYLGPPFQTSFNFWTLVLLPRLGFGFRRLLIFGFP
ncbi:hypothetical protein DENSPDRAFT_911428 [Dentipellis sp. KUC8613]|nr:hypothetical protein DENSPDRAFT_911428 [Dentipellis sp. KUC8613]